MPYFLQDRKSWIYCHSSHRLAMNIKLLLQIALAVLRLVVTFNFKIQIQLLNVNISNISFRYLSRTLQVSPYDPLKRMTPNLDHSLSTVVPNSFFNLDDFIHYHYALWPVINNHRVRFELVIFFQLFTYIPIFN